MSQPTTHVDFIFKISDFQGMQTLKYPANPLNIVQPCAWYYTW